MQLNSVDDKINIVKDCWSLFCWRK